MQLQIQVFSDIHLEFKSKPIKIKSYADYLFLAGDIGRLNGVYKDFVSYCSKNWLKTFIILGNHEYYHNIKDYSTLNSEYKEFFEKFNNVYLLDNSYVELNNEINVYGTTLWTPPSTNISNLINDYKYINYLNNESKKIENITEEFVSLLSNYELTNLKNYLNNTNKKTIILTHFPPIQENTSHPKYVSSSQEIKDYFAWDNLTLTKSSNILCWISGHTHYSYDFTQDNVRYISNQFGYSNEVYESKINIYGLYDIKLK
jgi:predicted phosphohydrolase